MLDGDDARQRERAARVAYAVPGEDTPVHCAGTLKQAAGGQANDGSPNSLVKIYASRFR